MNHFLQVHMLTFYPPANLNRDDIGRPKTAMIGNALRLRISSQALKRAWRTSEIFVSALDDYRGERTRRIGVVIRDELIARGTTPDRATEIVRTIVPVFGALETDEKDSVRTKQLVFVAPEERAAALALAEQAAAGKKIDPSAEQLLVRDRHTAADIAMFGRMLANNVDYNVEAAVQVAHAFTTHKIAVEDDYYVGVDDLNPKEEHAGAGFVGEAGFGSGLFYLYMCIDAALFQRNLAETTDINLARTALEALIRSAAQIPPRGKQASYASRGYANYILAEIGDQTPRTLGGAFLVPVAGADPLAESVAAVRLLRHHLNEAYGLCADRHNEMEVGKKGSLDEIVAFCLTVLNNV